MSAHYIEADSDCMGRPTTGYWREFRNCSDGHVVIGFGESKAAAEVNAMAVQAQYEDSITEDPRIRLRKLINSGTRLTVEGDAALKAIAEILLGEKL